MKKLYFSPSDQNENAYTGVNTNENDQCERIATACVAAAERCGFQAKTNLTASMASRVAEGNRWGADAYIPIHTNAFNGSVTGTRMFCASFSGPGYKLCRAVMARLAPITPGTSDSITERNGLYEVRETNMCTAYIEVGFHDNATEAKWMVEHTQEIAEAIVQGCCDYFGVAYVEPGVDPTPEPTPAPAPTNPLYRVRKTWTDAASQIGAFAVLENAKRMADEHPGYSVYDENGKAIYTASAGETVHTVKAGDTLWGIAEKYLGSGIRYKEIQAANGLKSDTIYSGQKLTIPSATSGKSLDDLALEVYRGDWGNGQERIDRLTAAGYDAAAVQNRVNTLYG